MNSIKTIRLSATYGAPPIFDADVQTMGYVDPRDLPIDGFLLDKLEEWNDRFQQTFCDDYPPDSGFLTSSDYERHNSEGAALAAVLREELGERVSVEFLPLIVKHI